MAAVRAMCGFDAVVVLGLCFGNSQHGGLGNEDQPRYGFLAFARP